MRVLRTAAIVAFMAGPAAAGPALEQLAQEAEEEAVSAVVVPAALANKAAAGVREGEDRDAPGDSERQAQSLGELRALQNDTGEFHPLSPIEGLGKPDDPNWRKLTSGEIELLRPIFRDGIKYSKVWIYRGKWNIFQPDNVIMAPNGNIYWPPGAGYRSDFSSSGFQRWYLVHEMTHVYQYQQGISVIARRLAEGGAYSYVLDPSKTMNDYTIEQQGNMVADYDDCTRRQGVDECRRRFSPTMAGFLEDANWLRKDEERRRRLEREEAQRRPNS